MQIGRGNQAQSTARGTKSMPVIRTRPSFLLARDEIQVADSGRIFMTSLRYVALVISPRDATIRTDYSVDSLAFSLFCFTIISVRVVISGSLRFPSIVAVF